MPSAAGGDELDVDPVGELLLEPGALDGQVDRAGSSTRTTRWGLPMSAVARRPGRPGRPGARHLGRGTSGRADRAHVASALTRPVVGVRGAEPRPGARRRRWRRHRCLALVAGHGQGLGQAADAVAADLGPAAVGVEQVHDHVDLADAGLGRAPWIRPSAPIPRRRSQSRRASSPSTAGTRPFTSSSTTRKSLARPWCLVSCTRSVSQAGRRGSEGIVPGFDPVEAGVAAEPPLLAAGEAPGAAHGRAIASSRVTPGQVGQQLPVAEGLAGGAGQPAGPGGQGRHLGQEAGRQLGLVAGVDAGRARRGPGAGRPSGGRGG